MDKNKVKPIMILSPISLGELLDKISILKVKMNKISEEKLASVIYEYELLIETLEKAVNENKLDILLIEKRLAEMVQINSNQWDIEDRVRELRKNNDFGTEFLSASEGISISNKHRVEVKNNINIEFGSNVEVKSYFGEN